MNIKIAIIGLGYVGLPLARLFATKYPVVGFDINQRRISDLNLGNDSTLEIDEATLKAVLVTSPSDSNGLFCTNIIDSIRDCNYYIVTVPTPVDKNNRPDLTPLYKSSETVGKVLKKGDIVIYESTVYPGVTEEECVPVLEKISGLKFNVDFFAGYSPERINPGDKEHTVEKILKVTSGSTPEIGILVNDLYKSVITAGTHLAPSIKVAEAAKVIENSQRDINIAFMNELSIIFDKMGINTFEVLAAAGTKWNFLKFQPGLVGGHCIGVDPYYLTYKSQKLGYDSQVILAGRIINDGMAGYIAKKILIHIIRNNGDVKNAKVLVMGATFKENVSDIRNSKVADVIKELKSYSLQVHVTDPHANSDELNREYSFELTQALANDYEAVVVAVPHAEYLSMDDNSFSKITKPSALIADIKGIYRGKISSRDYWSL